MFSLVNSTNCLRKNNTNSSKSLSEIRIMKVEKEITGKLESDIPQEHIEKSSAETG
jgi:hypothetical protein